MDYTDGEKRKLNHRLSKRYAKAKRTFELGIWGYDIELIKGFTLTTALNTYTRTGRERNCWSQLIRDNRNHRIALRQEGVLAEDCSCVEVSPLNHLFHMHGFYRLKAPYYAKDLHAIVSEQWKKSHGAEVVWIKDLWDISGAIKYDVKHAVKNYITEGNDHMRMVKSKGWLPFGWSKAQKAVVNWALEKVDFLPEDDDIVSPEYYNREYVYDKWAVATDYIRRWCEGEEILLDMRGKLVLVCGNEVIESEAGYE